MKKDTNLLTFYLSLVLLVLLTLCTTNSGRSEDAKKSDCCFTHEGYQGACRVTPAEDETCETILKYLNTPGTVGKSYCGGTKLRGGWKQVECPSDEK